MRYNEFHNKVEKLRKSADKINKQCKEWKVVVYSMVAKKKKK